MKRYLVFVFLLLAALIASPSWAQLAKVDGVWVRGTVAGQNATGAFMTIVSSQDLSLVGASSPLAKTVEIHEMAMEGGVMRMRALKSLELPAGKRVEFKPGGYHIMLLGLAKPLAAGETVPIELTLVAKDKKFVRQSVSAEVRELGTAVPEGHQHHH